MSEKKSEPESIQTEGILFEKVQTAQVFKDSKTFVDSQTKLDPSQIMEKFSEFENQESRDLKSFLESNFDLPSSDNLHVDIEADNMKEYIQKLWSSLTRPGHESGSENSTLIPLSNRYVVPGGRFREIYYWDSYFTMEGLAACNNITLVEEMADNFASLIKRFGFIPNGNRSYYLTRSQPPLFFLMIDIIEREKNFNEIKDFVSLVEKEYSFWMKKRKFSVEGGALNLFSDEKGTPRPESYIEDIELVSEIEEDLKPSTYKDIRAAAESGWDFSSRWFENSQEMKSIQTTDILPVDLNSILYGMEKKLSEWTSGEKSKNYRKKADSRKNLFDKYFWDEEKGFYFDYNHEKSRQEDTWSLAAVTPLFFEIASDEQAEQVKQSLEDRFLADGGLLTTLSESGQQWDKPNGWAPLHWFAINGLLNYGHRNLAQEIAERWIDTNRDVFKSTGQMQEKYNVVETNIKAEDGEYVLQNGFGWTNGVAIALLKNRLLNGNSGKLNTESLKSDKDKPF